MNVYCLTRACRSTDSREVRKDIPKQYPSYKYVNASARDLIAGIAVGYETIGTYNKTCWRGGNLLGKCYKGAIQFVKDCKIETFNTANGQKTQRRLELLRLFSLLYSLRIMRRAVRTMGRTRGRHVTVSTCNARCFSMPTSSNRMGFETCEPSMDGG